MKGEEVIPISYMSKDNIETMEDLGQALEASYSYMGNGEYDTDTLLAWENINKYFEEEKILNVEIIDTVNKGAIAEVEGVRAFIPVSRLDINHVENVNDWLGKTIRVKIIEADMEENKLVLSAREILRQESEALRKSQKEKEYGSINVGDVLEGSVESIMDYGAFVKLTDEVSGLVHISQIANRRIASPREELKEGETVRVKVIKKQDGKISLSIKELLEDERIREEEEIKNNIPEVEEIGTSLGSLLSGIKLD